MRDDNSDADIVFQTSDTTWYVPLFFCTFNRNRQAYNCFGSANTYGRYDYPSRRAYKVSYSKLSLPSWRLTLQDRPLETRKYRDINTLWGNEYPTIRFLEKNGYSVTYISGVDTDRYGDNILKKHKAFLSVGHDEYWSKQQRKNVEDARDLYGGM